MATNTKEDMRLLAEYLTHTPAHLERPAREQLINICHDVIASLETPIETARKHAFLALDQAVVRSAIQLGIFELLWGGGTGGSPPMMTTRELADGITKTATTPPRGGDVAVLTRLLRYLATPLRLVRECGPGLWKATPRGLVLADPALQSGCAVYFDSCGPAFQALPGWLCASPGTGGEGGEEEDQQGRAPATAFQAAMPSEEGGFFGRLRRDANAARAFQTWMDVLARHQLNREESGVVDIATWIPHEGVAPDEVIFVDVGGGAGGQCVALRQRLGSRPGRIVNQDVAALAEAATADLQARVIESMAHDFFTEQPVKGAYVYHCRQIFHDWPEQDCLRILGHIRRAMVPRSTLLIDDVVMPEQGVHWMVTQRDLTMLALFNAKERSESQWRNLLSQAGLRVEEIIRYDEKMAACVIVVTAP